MADVTLTYKGNTILELNDSATKSIKTAGKYLEDDIGLTYVDPGGSGGSTEPALRLNISVLSTLILLHPLVL